MELGYRLVLSYVAQAAISAIIALAFYHFGRLYQRKFLKHWAASWVGFTILCIGYALSTMSNFMDGVGLYPRLIFTIIHVFGGLLQIFLLSAGTYELLYRVVIPRRKIVYTMLVALVVALIISLTYAFDPDGKNVRYFLRMGLRPLFAGLVFIISGITTFYSKRLGPGFGKTLLALAFSVYGIELMAYFFTVAINATGGGLTTIYSFLGILDLFLISLIGLGMIIWLLEDESARLKKTNTELDSFLYSTSHDLRAPIASVLGLTNIAQREVKEPAIGKYFSMIEERVKRLDEIIGDILTYSKSSKSIVTKEPIDFNKLLDEVIGDLKFNEGASNIALKYEESPKNTFYTDRSQVVIILKNLLANAVKYHDSSKSNQYIKVLFEKKIDKVTIKIEDNGIGVEEESIPKIFDMFYRGTTESKGSGLGLFIVKEATNKIGGKVWVESVQGEGSTFTLQFNEEHLT